MEFFRIGAIIEVSNIQWDTDEETAKANDLPTELVLVLGDEIEGTCLDEEEIYDRVSEYLSDNYGFCHNGFSLFVTNFSL